MYVQYEWMDQVALSVAGKKDGGTEGEKTRTGRKESFPAKY